MKKKEKSFQLNQSDSAVGMNIVNQAESPKLRLENITYISVLERTKEIGILRSIGASKKDISRVFNTNRL